MFNTINHSKRQANLYLRNYLQPNGRYPYEQLFSDMENWRLKGFSVIVLSVSNVVMAFCVKDSQKQQQPWVSHDEFYSSAKECIDYHAKKVYIPEVK